jgi:cell wall-associated NlpC family hydrolase
MTNKDILYDYLMTFNGIPYQWGGANRLTGLDCSGLVLEFLSAAGLWQTGDTTSQGLYQHFVKAGAKVAGTPQFGDLCFYGNGTAGISHISVALNDKLMIEAGGGDQTTTSPAAARTKGAMVRVRPITRRKDLVAILRVMA